MRAVNTWFCCDDNARSCSTYSATRDVLQLVCYQLGLVHVSVVRMQSADVSVTCSHTLGTGVRIASVSIHTYAGGSKQMLVSTGAVSAGACL